jgi:transcriptional regulator with XRE-family HTH domain
MLEKNLTQEKLAQKVGCSRQLVSCILHCKVTSGKKYQAVMDYLFKNNDHCDHYTPEDMQQEVITENEDTKSVDLTILASNLAKRYFFYQKSLRHIMIYNSQQFKNAVGIFHHMLKSKIDYETILEVMEFIFTNKDSYWYRKVFRPKKIQERFANMYAELQNIKEKEQSKQEQEENKELPPCNIL